MSEKRCAVLAVTLLVSVALAEDKSGVSPQAISRPQGPGSLEGLGDSFQPALNTGMARYRVPFALPEGTAGLTPSLGVSYDSGLGFGPVGIGWSLGPGSVRRQADEGLPRYGDAPDGQLIPDRYLGVGGEELVPLQNGYYLAKIEDRYTRYRQVDSHWEAHTTAGTKLEFGFTAAARVSDPDDATQIYKWRLEKQTDVHGNVIEYAYEMPVAADRQIYLRQIRYGPGDTTRPHSYVVNLEYEDRPDPFTDYRSGFRVHSAKRLKHVDIKYDDALIRRYELSYDVHEHWSLLSSVTPIGADGASQLPATTFTYNVFNIPPPLTTITAAGSVVASQGEPTHVFDHASTDFVDLNFDGLPDLLAAVEGNHRVCINYGQQDVAGETVVAWGAPITLSTANPAATAYRLEMDNVHLADMDADGLSDLVVTTADFVRYFQNSGTLGWGASVLMAGGTGTFDTPPAPFGPSAADVRIADLSFNKRIDVIKTYEGSVHAWFNLGGDEFSSRTVNPGLFRGSEPVLFSDPGVHLADMNGDGLDDIVKVRTTNVLYWPSRGYARFDDLIQMAIPDEQLIEGSGESIQKARLVDINGDSLSDLVIDRADGNRMWFWLNLGNGTFDRLRIITGLPISANADLRWVDINGNGSTDVVYGDSTRPDSRIHAVDLAVMLGGSQHYNVLTSIDNGYGRKTHISYKSSVEQFLDAQAAGNPWTTSIPFPTAVVSRAEVTFGLNLDGYDGADPLATITVPDGDDVYITDYVYRDGYWDALERQFRGFAFVKQINHGDERFGGTSAPTLVTRFGFHTGAPDGEDNDGDGNVDEVGSLWIGREEEPLKGVELWHEVTALPDEASRDGQFADDSVVFARVENTWTVRNLCQATGGALADLLGDATYATADPGYDREVRQAVRTHTLRTVIERRTDPNEHKHLENRSDVDPLGNTLFEWKLGDLDDANDDLYTGYEYALNEQGWIVDRVSRTFQTDGDAEGAFVSETRNYYDGAEFEGLPLGEMGSRGVLHRSESLISKDPVPPIAERSFLIGDPRDPNGRVDTLRQQVDAYGNPIVLRDAKGHDRLLDYDQTLHKFPIRETIVVGNGSPDLDVSATYDFRLGTLLTLTGLNGHVSRFTYDTFGRLEKVLLPGDDDASPTSLYSYDLGAPISRIITVAHDNVNNSPDLTTMVFFDGLGRELGTYDAGGGVMSGVTLYNIRGNPWKVYQPYFGGDGTWSLPPDTVPATTHSYDATGRVIKTVTPPDDDDLTARITAEYLPLMVKQYDGEDNNTTRPHYNTPKTLVSDGLGRLIEVHEIENLSVDSGVFVTKYRYALPDLLGEIEDSNGNIKYMRYDGLGRRIFMNDLDRGAMTDTYDSAGNLLSSVDALGQKIAYTYDGANRLLTQDYLDDGHPLSLNRTPDIAYHYDQRHPDFPALGNIKGELSWIEDLTGAEVHGFDDLGTLETVVKRIDQPDGSFKDYRSISLSDNLNRVYQNIFPDGGAVRYAYDARGLLDTVPGFVEQLTYNASGQKDFCALSSGTIMSYDYDPRLRLNHLFTQSASVILQDLSYHYDQVTNILGITDNRQDIPPYDPRNQSATFTMDNTYRLIEAFGTGYGTITYDYDRLGNMALKTSPDIDNPDVNLGAMLSGGSGGTSGRIGRNPGDPPGPHALTATDNGVDARSFDYDDNGNMVDNNGDVYLYDFANRLGRVVKDGSDSRYLYDHTGRRVIKRVNGVQTSYINGSSEIRDGRMIKYVFADQARRARVEGPLPHPNRVVQVIDLAPGWNLVSFQVDPGVTVPAAVLASIDGLYTVVYGHDGNDHLRYLPGGSDHTLTELIPNRGYWIKMSEAASLRLEGPVSVTTVDIPADTPMLIGIPGLTAQSIESLLSQYAAIEGLWAYTSAAGEWSVFGTDALAYVNTLDETASGRGYWVRSSANITLTLPQAGEVHFYHSDHLGSTNVVTDGAGNLTTETYNYPFGLLRHKYDTGKDFDPFYQFTDKEQDKESGLHYFEARYYGSPLARFIRVDPLLAGQPRLESPQDLNLYAYARNQPLIYTDPTGLKPRRSPNFSITSVPGVELDQAKKTLTLPDGRGGSIEGKLKWDAGTKSWQAHFKRGSWKVVLHEDKVDATKLSPGKAGGVKRNLSLSPWRPGKDNRPEGRLDIRAYYKDEATRAGAGSIPSAYGRGTTKYDKAAGATSLRFHEGLHEYFQVLWAEGRGKIPSGTVTRKEHQALKDRVTQMHSFIERLDKLVVDDPT